MLVVVVLLPFSLSIYNGEFDHGGGGSGSGNGGGGGGSGGGGRQSPAKAAGNESVDGCMMACDDEIGRWTTLQQPTNKRQRDGGDSNGGCSAIT
jgi:hypothetical protein